MNISKSINIEYQWNRQNVEKLFDSSYDFLFKNSKKRYIGWFFIALFQFGVVASIKQGTFGLLLFSTIVLIYWYYIKKIVAKKRVLKEFENSAFKDKLIMIEAKENGLEIKSPKKDFWRWEDIDKVKSLDEDIMIYKAPNFYYIPSSAFESYEYKNEFKKLAKIKTK